MFDLIVDVYTTVFVVSFFTLIFTGLMSLIILCFQVICLWFVRTANENVRELHN